MNQQAIEGDALRDLLERLPAAAYTCDADGRLTYYNEPAAALWGRRPLLNDDADRYTGAYRLYDPQGQAIANDRSWMAQALKEGRAFEACESVVERPDGERRAVLTNTKPFLDTEGRPVGGVNVMVDITERKRAEALLQEAHRARNAFLASLAHALRNPLVPVRNSLKTLQLKAQDLPDWQAGLAVIERQVQDMARLIDQLLDFSQASGEVLALRREPVDLRKVLGMAVEASRPAVEGGRLHLEVHLTDAPLPVEADVVRLAQALATLLESLARRTEPEGRLELSLTRERAHALCSLRSTGCDLPRELLPRLFDLFAGGEQEADKSLEGLGIGLALVKRVIELHGGRVRAWASRPAGACEFRVRLPLPLPAAATTTEEAAGEAAPPQRPPAVARGLRVLIVDDHPDSAASLAELLQVLGHEALAVRDGQAALDAASRLEPQVVLLDIGLPKMDGYAVARALRAEPWGREARLIAVTGWGQDADRARSREAGFDLHLVKPVEPDALIDLLDRLANTP